MIVPCGVNIIDGSNIEQEQEYESLVNRMCFCIEHKPCRRSAQMQRDN